ncbi:MAG: hypothetical protein PWP70_1118 [Moorella sp. (in: firmicutes)]|nr:hypothetical protein [Moorella sp. (in: firmicutes)]
MTGIRVELHCHTRLWNWQPFSWRRLEGFCRRARQLGLDWLGITEHADAPGFWDIFAILEDNKWRWQDLRLLAGCEITVAEEADILLLGPPEALLDLKGYLSPWPARHNRPPLRDLLPVAAELQMLKVAAHPFRPGRDVGKVPRELLQQLDALEINARELKRAAAVTDLARRLGLPLVGGSDAHLGWQVGRAVNQLPAGVRDLAGWRAALSRGENRVLLWQERGYVPFAAQR